MEIIFPIHNIRVVKIFFIMYSIMMMRILFISLITTLFIAPAKSVEWTAVSANHHAKFFVN
tara:strand:+ start:1514 stop:1696 length:183 start_codon:yes stop_codon:yes gene_type:complete